MASDAHSSPDPPLLAELLRIVEIRGPDRLAILGERRHAAPPGAAQGLLAACARYRLSDAEVLLLLVALGARAGGQRSLTGGELVAAAFDDAASRLTALSLLVGEASLVSGGFLSPEVVPGHPAEAETTAFRLGGHAFRLACEDLGLPPPPPRSAPGAGPYRSNGEILTDLRRLSLHYRRRAARVFQLDLWAEPGLESLEATTALLHRARAEAWRVQRRLSLTQKPERFAVLALRVQHGLELDELVILVTVLFEELLQGVGSVDAVDLVKLVSESEADLVTRRMLLRPLARKGLLRLDGCLPEKELTADASLPNSVIERLLDVEGPIGADDRLDFHAFLEQLDGSEDFFLEMDGPDEE